MIQQRYHIDPAKEDCRWARHKGLDPNDLKSNSKHNRAVRFENSNTWPNHIRGEYENGSGAKKRFRPELGPQHVDQTAE